MRVCCLFSGGKDSSYSLHRMLLSGFEVPVLLVMRPEDPDSWLYQSSGMEVSHLFSELTGIQTEIIDAPAEGEEEGLADSLADLKDRYALSAICSGAIRSDFQRMNFSDAAWKADLISYTPIWRKDGTRFMRELVSGGFSFMLISYASPGFTPHHLGRTVTPEMLEELLAISERYGSHPAFEGGEAETLVLSAPLYRGRLDVEGGVETSGQFNARYLIREAKVT